MPLARLVLWTLLSSTLSQTSTDWPYEEAPRVRALSALDGVAVLQTANGEIQTVRVGDEIEEGLRVVKVLEDRLVVEGDDPTTGDPKFYWIYRAGPSEKSSRVVAFSRKAPTETAAIPGEPEGDADAAQGEERGEERARPKKNPE